MPQYETDCQVVIDAVRRAVRPLSGRDRDHDHSLDLVGDAPIVPTDEASHGTHDLCCERAEISRRLIGEKGFAAIAAEADWADVDRANCDVRGGGSIQRADRALSSFQRFPKRIRRNQAVLDFVATMPPVAARPGFAPSTWTICTRRCDNLSR